MTTRSVAPGTASSAPSQVAPAATSSTSTPPPAAPNWTWGQAAPGGLTVISICEQYLPASLALPVTKATALRSPIGSGKTQWIANNIPAGMTVYCGHDQRSTDGRPYRRTGLGGGEAVFLDTGAGKGGHLSWIDLDAAPAG